MMRKIFLATVMLMLTLTTFAQGMSDAQVLSYSARAKKAGVPDTEIVTRLLQRGATMTQIQSLRAQYNRQLTNHGLAATADNAIANAENRMRVNNGETSTGVAHEREEIEGEAQETVEVSAPARKVFGRDIFNKSRLTFEPSMNIATPQNYVLGPGDQIVIDVYGATQESMKLTISPEGDVNVPECGPVQVSGMTVAAAQSRIRSALGQFYESSSIRTTLGQTRTITVNVMGEVRVPGTYTLSSFSTVFHALYMAGGVSDLGTLRNIKVYRQGKLISVVDVYEFILHGRLAGNVRLDDNDVIQVGPYESIVDIGGFVKRPMAYEMRSDESLATLLEYCGGFTGDAYKSSMRLLRKNGKKKSVFNIEEFDMSSFKVEDGDVVTVDGIYDRYENMVEIKGAVFRPGMYQLGDKVNSVRTLIERAEGLTEEAMTTRAVLRRMKPNRTQEVMSLDLEGILNGTVADVALANEDILLIPKLAEHQNIRTVQIAGEVIFPGTYEFADKMTIEDLILQAGGLTDGASTSKVDVSRRIWDPSAMESGLQTSKTYTFPIADNFVITGEESFYLEPYDVVQVRRSPVYRAPIQVTIEGEVAFPGAYTLESKNQKLSDVVAAAGGIMPGAYVRGSRLVRTMNQEEIERARDVIRMARQNADGKDSISLRKLSLRTTYTIGVRLDEAIADPDCNQNVELMEGDRIVVPSMNSTIRVSGDVQMPNTVAFVPGESFKYYINQSGGFGDRARKNKAYVVYQNGTMSKAKKAKLEPGCEIVVPSKGPRNHTSASQWIGIGTSVASLATMIATIVNLTK